MKVNRGSVIAPSCPYSTLRATSSSSPALGGPCTSFAPAGVAMPPVRLPAGTLFQPRGQDKGRWHGPSQCLQRRAPGLPASSLCSESPRNSSFEQRRQDGDRDEGRKRWLNKKSQ